MSGWPEDKKEAQAGNVTPLRRSMKPKDVAKTPKKNKNRVINPRVYLDETDTLVMNLEGLRENNGQIRSMISHLLPKDTVSINRITPVERADGSLAYFEFRLDTKDGGKAYRTIFKADVSGSDDSREDGAQYLAEFSALSAKELYVPTNAPALVEAQRLYEKGEVAKVAIYWCEGEKARQAVEARLSQEYAQDKFEELGVYPVTAATLGGGSGAKSTNYALRPSPKIPGEYTAAGKNDVALKLDKYTHFIVLDNDKAGRDEGIALANKFEREYRVDKENIFFVEPPIEAFESWDDADPLPYTISEEDRIDMFFAASPVADSWVMKPVKGGGFEVDAENVDNRLLALKRIGITEAHINTSTGQRHVKGPFPFENGMYPNQDERTKLIRAGLQAMGVPAKVAYMRGWEEVFSLLFTGAMRDTIYEEIMRDIESGRANMNDENKPEMLFIRSLGLEDTPYHREAGRLCIRDFLAATLLPAYRHPAIEPQLLFVLHGGENQGKSTFAKVLSGGALDGKSHARFQDQVQMHDLFGSASHGFFQLKQKLEGVTVAEFADQDLGDNVRAGLAGALKRFANMGQVQYRNMYAEGDQNFNLRCIRIFTTNKPDILTDDMGFRRFIILDVAKTRLPTKAKVEETLAKEKRTPTEYEAMILRGHNPNLNWLVENRSAMLAHMFESNEWRGTLSVSATMQELMKEMQTPYKAQQNWEIKLLAELQQYFAMPNLGIAAHYLVDWATDYRGEGRPTRRKWSAFMTSLGFRCDNKSVNNQAVRHYYINADKASSIDKFLCWAPSTSGDQGRWILSDKPNPDKIELMAKTLGGGSDVPF